MGPSARILPDGNRLHLQHGPSDLIVYAEGDRARAYKAAAHRFETIIAEVVSELPILRERITPLSKRPLGAVARRMFDAARPFAGDGVLTPMAAVAGAIADEVLAAMTAGTEVARAYVNNGGDIAVHLAEGQAFSSAIARHDGARLGTVRIASDDPIRGIATSGRHGRSLSLGIADSVTALAGSAAEADVAATLIANAVDLPGHPAIARRPAREIIEDSDLGDLPVVVGCGLLEGIETDEALAAGWARSEVFRSAGLIAGSALFLRDRCRTSEGCNVEPAIRELTDA